MATALLVTTAGILLALPYLQVQQLRGWAVRESAYLDARFLTMLG